MHLISVSLTLFDCGQKEMAESKKIKLTVTLNLLQISVFKSVEI